MQRTEIGRGNEEEGKKNADVKEDEAEERARATGRGGEVGETGGGVFSCRMRSSGV